MNIKIKSFLECILHWINAKFNNNLKETDNILLREIYEDVKKNNEIKQLYLFLNEEYKDSPDILIMIFSIIFGQIKDKEIIAELYRLIGRDDINVFYANWIRAQINHYIFLDRHFNVDYSLARDVQESLTKRLKLKLDLTLPFIDVKDRDRDSIVVLTDQFLSDLHAPTSVVKRFCYELKKNGNKKVALMVCPENTKETKIPSTWLSSDSFCFNYSENLTGNFSYTYRDEVIHGKQVILDEDNLDNIKNFITYLYNLKPYFVWYIGGLAVFPELINDFTTLISQKCTSGYPVSSASLMINWLDDHSEDTLDIQKDLQRRSQHTAAIKIYHEYEMPRHIYQRRQFGIPDKSFVLLLVGNRLDSEIKEEFINILIEILERFSDFFILIIGDCKNEHELFSNGIFHNRVKNIGFQDQLIEALTLGDLFINPPRQGGGRGAAMALSIGIPIVTLDNCDVSAAAGKDFSCENLDEMRDLVLKYRNNTIFLEEQKKKAIERHYETGNNLTENIIQILNLADTITGDCEI